MKIQIFFAVLAFITKSHCYHQPIQKCGNADSLTTVCASNGRTYENKCDFLQDKLFINQKLHILHPGRCYNTIPEKKYWKVEEKPPPQYIIDEESPEYIIDGSYETEKPWSGIISDIINKKVNFGKKVIKNVEDTIASLFNYNVNKRKKRIIFKKKKGCFYCPRNT